MTYQKILLPINGRTREDKTIKALERALRLINGELIILHAMEPLPKIVGGEAHMDLLREAREESMQLIAPAVKFIEQTGIPYRVRLEEGNPAETIIHVAHEEHCDLIVMFTDGRDELGDMLLGSTTERVLRNTDIPLLAIRK